MRKENDRPIGRATVEQRSNTSDKVVRVLFLFLFPTLLFRGAQAAPFSRPFPLGLLPSSIHTIHKLPWTQPSTLQGLRMSMNHFLTVPQSISERGSTC